MVPQASHPVWTSVITGDKVPHFEYLVTKMQVNTHLTDIRSVGKYEFSKSGRR